MLPGLLSAFLLSACGGGGGGGAAEPTTNATRDSTALNSFTTARMPQNFRAASAVPAQDIEAAAAALPAAAGPTYLKVWVADPETGQPDVLSFGRFASGQALPKVQPPSAVGVVHFEIYNAAGSRKGQWSLQ